MDVQNNAATYQGVFGNGTSIRYTPTLSGVKEDIVLSRYTGKNSFSFTLNTGDLSVFEDENGYYIANTEESKEQIRIGSIIAYDSAEHETFGTLHIIKNSGGSYIVIVSLSSEFLSAESTVFPVTIDPSLTITDTQYMIDTSVYADSPYSQTHLASLYRTAGLSASMGIGKTFVKFTGLHYDQLFNRLNSANVLSLCYYVKAYHRDSTYHTLVAHPIHNDWTLNSLQWSSSNYFAVDLGENLTKSDILTAFQLAIYVDKPINEQLISEELYYPYNSGVAIVSGEGKYAYIR